MIRNTPRDESQNRRDENKRKIKTGKRPGRNSARPRGFVSVVVLRCGFFSNAPSFLKELLDPVFVSRFSASDGFFRAAADPMKLSSQFMRLKLDEDPNASPTSCINLAAARRRNHFELMDTFAACGAGSFNFPLTKQTLNQLNTKICFLVHCPNTAFGCIVHRTLASPKDSFGVLILFLSQRGCRENNRQAKNG